MKQKKSILLVFPSDKLSNALWLEERIIILKSNGIYYYDKKNEKRLKFKSNRVIYELNQIRELINWWGPIIERWIGKSLKYEDLRSNICFLVNYLTSAFEYFNITKIIHFTGLPHHIDSVTVDIAANINKIKQIYFYVNIIDGKIIPIEHKYDIKNRKILLSRKKNNVYEKKIDSFILNNLSGNLPVVNSSISNYKKSYNYAYFLLTLKWVKNKIFKLRKKNPFENNMFYFKEDDFSNEDLFEIIKRQKEFIKEYKKRQINFNHIIKTDTLPKIIIYGNYQPEATTFPEGVNYSNHLDIVIKLRKIGINENIFYKEHPASFMYLDTPSVFLTKVSLYKNLNFIRLLDLYNCKLVDTNFKFQNSSDLLEKIIVITITGTIAIERALNGYKTIICGNPYFKDMPGLIHIEKLKSPNDIYEIDFDYDENIKKESKYFLKELLENSTLENPFGIGTGKKYDSSFEEMKFFLLSQIKKNKSIINED